MHLGTRNRRHVHHSVVRSPIPRGMRTQGVDGLPEIGEIGRQVMAIQLRRRRARVDIGDQVTLLDEVLENPVTGLASPTGDKNAFFRHGIMEE